jgi:8-oxo-dGTP pyrophosphatase MutT (NUDIX family)
MRTVKDIPPKVRDRLDKIIRKAISTSKAQFTDEIASGMNIRNKPTAIITTQPMPIIGATPPGEHEEDVWVIRPDRHLQRLRFSKGEAMYVEARHAWNAYPQIERILREELGWTADEIFPAITDIFPKGHHVYGVLTLLFHRDGNGELFVLMGIRSKKLAGPNVGFASFPGGLTKPGEYLATTCLRELREEGACGQIEIFPGFAMRPHNTIPCTTFMRMGQTTSLGIAESYEWEGKAMTWIPLRALRVALFEGDNALVVDAFHSRNIGAPDDLQIAPDTIDLAKTLLDTFIL